MCFLAEIRSRQYIYSGFHRRPPLFFSSQLATMCEDETGGGEVCVAQLAVFQGWIAVEDTLAAFLVAFSQFDMYYGKG
jgi:hypothetical protein